MTDKPCNEIVIDAANLIHDDRGIEVYDENGDTIPQMIPERLFSAVEENQMQRDHQSNDRSGHVPWPWLTDPIDEV